ncbi:MAG: ATPase [Gammaproteobacteria bacterium]|nr:ATPase [Gammaproteobacteria bacterium]MDH3534510.1 ATPase [Gammaproteobacteria bacterium]
MRDSLKDLLAAETEAEAVVTAGEVERDRIVQKGLDDALDMERQFKERLPEMQQSFTDKAQSRAEQTIAEMKLRYDERNKTLRELADRHEQEALDHAIALILNREPRV